MIFVTSINEKEIVSRLLNIELVDIMSTKEYDISGWNSNFNVNICNSTVQKPINNKSKFKVNNNLRLPFGMRPSKVNNFKFQFYNDIQNYIVQYRNENKSHKCFSDHSDSRNIIGTVSNFTVPDSYSVKPEPIEKSLNYQVQFWRNQNPELDKYRCTSIELTDISKQIITSHVIGLHTTSILPPCHKQRYRYQSIRNNIANKKYRNMIIPQSSTYDMLSDDIRVMGNVDIDKLTTNFKGRTQTLDELGLVNFQVTRENNKLKNPTKEENSLEFAKLLDERLKVLYEQRNIYQPAFSFTKSKPETKLKKCVPRQKSANCQIRNDVSNPLSINGRSTGGKLFFTPTPKAEDQINLRDYAY